MNLPTLKQIKQTGDLARLEAVLTGWFLQTRDPLDTQTIIYVHGTTPTNGTVTICHEEHDDREYMRLEAEVSHQVLFSAIVVALSEQSYTFKIVEYADGCAIIINPKDKK
jgi:hypothetical protein